MVSPLGNRSRTQPPSHIQAGSKFVLGAFRQVILIMTYYLEFHSQFPSLQTMPRRGPEPFP